MAWPPVNRSGSAPALISRTVAITGGDGSVANYLVVLSTGGDDGGTDSGGGKQPAAAAASTPNARARPMTAAP